MRLRTIKDVKKLRGKRVLVRVDFNVPLKSGKIRDDYKIRKSLPTIEWLVEQGARVILVTHLGRPKGVVASLSLRPVCRHLEKALDTKIKLLPLSSIKKKLALRDGQVVMLENIRFLKDEEKDTGTLARDLAALADFYVFDAFGVAHRPAASISGVARFLPGYAGVLVSEELKALWGVLEKPKRPLVLVLGGTKLETKLPIITHLLPKVDRIVVGGSVAASFLGALGWSVGSSVVEHEQFAVLKKLFREKKLLLPVDVVVGGPHGEKAHVVVVSKAMRVKKTEAIYDIGPRTIALYAQEIKRAQTIVWNGAVGLFEQHPYEFGTKAIAQLLARRARGPAFVICGGGETVETVRTWGLEGSFDLVSTGGGALLEFLGGKKLPGIAAVEKK